MKLFLIFTLSILFLAAGLSATESQALVIKKLKLTIEFLKPLHDTNEKSGPDDWLAHHKEPGQTFDQYLKSKPVVLDKQRKILYIQLVGDFTESQQKIVKLTAEYMQIYFNAQVKTITKHGTQKYTMYTYCTYR